MLYFFAGNNDFALGSIPGFIANFTYLLDLSLYVDLAGRPSLVSTCSHRITNSLPYAGNRRTAQGQSRTSSLN